jgi:diadenosine tetraphosphate (Ap4A) HIT family hydrolase
LNVIEEQMDDCIICRKHRGEIHIPGGAVYEDDLVYAGHSAIPDGENRTYLGIFFVEPKRHVPGLAELTEDEAQRSGLLVTQLSKALKESEGAEHIYLFVMGHHVAHLHIWVVPRYPGTPRKYWGIRVDEWPGAPKGGAAEIEELCDRVRAVLVKWNNQTG